MVLHGTPSGLSGLALRWLRRRTLWQGRQGRPVKGERMEQRISAVILAAGRGTRMQGALSVPKPLASIDHEPLLQRNLRQLHENGIYDSIVVTGFSREEVEECARRAFPETRFVHNSRYEQDRNILSALLGLKAVPEGNGALLLEGDVVLSDTGFARLLGELRPDCNSWSACGLFQSHQVGGILRAEDGWVREIRYSGWQPELARWHKNLGAIHIAPDSLAPFVALLEEYAAASLDQYFMTPWLENLDRFPSRLVDLGEEGGSFNTLGEYEGTARRFTRSREDFPVRLLNIGALRHVEDFDPKRVEWLAQKISADAVWSTPLAVSRENIVMDGQHRLEAAKRLNLRRVPAVVFDYHAVPVRSLRPEISLDADAVVRNIAEGRPYPYKTVKHDLPPLSACGISLDMLRTDGE